MLNAPSLWKIIVVIIVSGKGGKMRPVYGDCTWLVRSVVVGNLIMFDAAAVHVTNVIVDQSYRA